MGSGRLAVITGSGVSVDDVAPGGEIREVELGDETVTLRDSGRGRGDRSARLGSGAAGASGRSRREPDRARRRPAAIVSLAVASTGSLRRDWRVGTVVLPDDFFGPWVTPSRYDDTRGHTMPGFDESWRSCVRDAWRAASTTPIIDGGVYVQTTGPRFETPAEVRFLATVGDVVGMTIAAECVLAKEIGVAYAAICMIDNMANGLDDVVMTLDDFEAGVAGNREQLVGDVRRVVRQLSERVVR